MTDLGGAQAGGRATAPAPPPARPMPTGQPVAVSFGNRTPGLADSQAAARAAAVATLSAARSAGAPPQWPVTAVSPPPVLVRETTKPPPPGPRRRRETGPLGGIGVAQLICWQLVLLAVILAAGRPWATIGVVALGALIVLAVTAMRVRGRWVYEWLFLSAQYFLRERDRDLRDAGGSGRALLRLIAPEAAGLRATVGEDSVFMVSRTAGITAVLQPKSTVRDLTVPPPEVLLPSPNEQSLAFAAQVVQHAGIGQERPLRVWVALQALRTVEVYQDTEVEQALGNALRRVQRRLHRYGLPTVGLTEDEFFGTLASLAHVTPDRSRVREQWQLWYSGSVSQATFALAGWARLSHAAAPQLSRRLLAATPYAAVTIAVTATRSAGNEHEVDAALRIAAASPPALEDAARVLTHVAAEWGVGMERLDGRHGWGMAATLPIGVAALPRR